MRLKGIGLVVTAVLLAACSPKGDALYARAEKSLEAGEINAAIIDLKNFVKDDPENAKGRALLASALIEGGEFAAAAIEIQKAKDLGAPADTLLVPECRVMTARREFTEVIEKCRPEAVGEDAKPLMHLALAEALLGLERADEAKPWFEAALAARPDSLDALLGLGRTEYALSGLPAAKAVLDKASDAIKHQPRYWMAMGSISTEGGDYAAAEAAFQNAVTNARKGAEEGERLMALGALAESQMRQAKVKEATATVEQLSKAAPNNPLVKMLKGKVAAAGGNLDEARTLLEEAVAAMPDNMHARTVLGVISMQQGNLGQAEMHFSTVLANEPKNVEAQKLLAATRAQLQSPEKSLQAMQSALTAEDADPSLLAMAGRMSLASGNREQALAYLTQASAAGGGDEQPASVQLEIASGYLMAGDIDRAVELLEKMPEGGASDLQREYLLVAALLRKGENDKAVAEAQALVERSASDPRARNLAAGVFAATGKTDAARAQFKEALKLKPNDSGTLVNLARLDLSDGKAADAEQGFRKVLATDPKHLVATVGVAVAAGARGETKESEKWLQKASTDHPDSVEAQMTLVQFYMGTRDYGKAKAVIDAAAQKAPDNAALANANGLAQVGLNDLPGALASFKQATTLAPKAYGYALNLARGHLANRDLPGTLDVLNGVLKSEPKYLPALALAAAVNLQAGEVEKATGYVERLRTAAPEAPGTFVLEGDLAMAQKRYGDALQYYRRAAASNPTASLVLAQYRAAVLAGEKSAEQVLEQWVAKNPNDAGVVAVLADVRQRKGDVDGAIKLYEQSLAKVPDNAVLLNNLAVLYDGKGSPKALELAERAYKLAPKAAAIQDTYGWILFKREPSDKSLQLLREASQGMPNSAEVQYHYAAALANHGDTAEAIELLKKAVKGELPPDVKLEAQQLLQRLAR